jgi:DNA-binding MarR family transcriptional regulator
MAEDISSSMSRLANLEEFRYTLRLFLSFSEKASEEEGVSVQQYQLLQVIATVPEGVGATIGFVAERMVLRHNSTVELVNRAARSGLVKRKIDPKDLRRSLVSLTPKGARVLVRLVPTHLAELDAHGNKIVHAVELLLAQSKGEQVASQNRDFEITTPIAACS